MASNYNSLGFNLMTTGENAGTWGTNTNLNLNYLRDMFGYKEVEMNEKKHYLYLITLLLHLMVELLL